MPERLMGRLHRGLPGRGRLAILLGLTPLGISPSSVEASPAVAPRGFSVYGLRGRPSTAVGGGLPERARVAMIPGLPPPGISSRSVEASPAMAPPGLSVCHGACKGSGFPPSSRHLRREPCNRRFGHSALSWRKRPLTGERSGASVRSDPPPVPARQPESPGGKPPSKATPRGVIHSENQRCRPTRSPTEPRPLRAPGGRPGRGTRARRGAPRWKSSGRRSSSTGATGITV